ncbi:MAG: CDP-glycerol glycerophosphotransferase family protein [Clostridium sp.]
MGNVVKIIFTESTDKNVTDEVRLNNKESISNLFLNSQCKCILLIDKLENIRYENLQKLEEEINLSNAEIFLTNDYINYVINDINLESLIDNNLIKGILSNSNGIILNKSILLHPNIRNRKQDFLVTKQFMYWMSKQTIEIQMVDVKITKYKIDKNNDVVKQLEAMKKIKLKKPNVDLLNMMKYIINNLSYFSKNTVDELVFSIKQILNLINDEEMFKFIEALNKTEANNMSFVYNMLKYFSKEQLMVYCEQDKYLKNIEEELSDKKKENEKNEMLLKGKNRNLVINISKAKHYLKTFTVTMLYNFTKPFFSSKNIWLIGERTDQAEDNAYVLFKYIRENNEKANIFYIIDKNSIQLEKVEKLGNVVYYDSFKHKLLLMHANILISAYDFFNFLLPSDREEFKTYYMRHMNSTRIFLQHGVALNKTNYYKKHINKYDYVLVSTIKENNMFTQEYGYENDKILKIGLPRYDNLIDLSNENKFKKILIMPTWRSSLVDLTDEEFIKSEYYLAINNLINNKEFINLIEKNNVEVIIYLHYQMQKFNHTITIKSKNIKLLSREEVIVQRLLQECNLLITDYSSVGVDFAYLNKPVIFYQFSSFNFHYNVNIEKEYTQYTDFGIILKSEYNVIETILRWCNSGYANFYDTGKEIFYNRGSIENCKKVYEFLKGVKKKRSDYKYVYKEVVNGIVREHRVYDKNYNFETRNYYNNKKLQTSRLEYVNGYINKQYIYDTKGRVLKIVKFFNGIALKTEYKNIYSKSGKILIKHITDKNSNLVEKRVYNAKGLKEKNIYNPETGKIIKVLKYYEDGTLQSELLYNDIMKPVLFKSYTNTGELEREYTYYENGKVKEKKFYDENTSGIKQIVKLSEINQQIIYKGIIEGNDINERILSKV